METNMNNNIEEKAVCPHCKHTFLVDVDLDEQIVYLPKDCSKCEHVFSSEETYEIESVVYADALSGWIDYQKEHRNALNS